MNVVYILTCVGKDPSFVGLCNVMDPRIRQGRLIFCSFSFFPDLPEVVEVATLLCVGSVLVDQGWSIESAMVPKNTFSCYFLSVFC